VINSARQRKLKARWVILGKLVLTSPAALGGSEDGLTDKPIIRDGDGNFMLTGESLTGALRNFLVDAELGYNKDETKGQLDLAERLFGMVKSLGTTDDGVQSPLIVFDAPSTKNVSEIRDGIRRNPKTGIVEDNAKFDFEVIPRCTAFSLRFDLLIGDYTKDESKDVTALNEEAKQLSALCWVLGELQKGEISLGGYKFKGLGQCIVKHWEVKRFDLSNKDGWLVWLHSDHESPLKNLLHKVDNDITKAIETEYGAQVGTSCDKRNTAEIMLDLEQVGGLLLSGGTGIAEANQLHSNKKPVLTGRSVNGALRARAEKIVNTLGGDGTKWGEQLFGRRNVKKKQRHYAARLTVGEGLLKDTITLYNTRVAIDPFTGGAVEGALFDETVVYGGKTKIKLTLREPKNCEIGLLLLVAKDLLLEDITFGGTVGIGRGRFKGSATLTHANNSYTFSTQKPHEATVTALEQYVKDFHQELTRGGVQ
jgi:CRISPR/Cas system CSM-associated protein Csm3 (group 7 of RAMP superfamily)